MGETAGRVADSTWFRALKYLTYGLLTINVFLFFQEEVLAAEHTFVDQFVLKAVECVFEVSRRDQNFCATVVDNIFDFFCL